MDSVRFSQSTPNVAKILSKSQDQTHLLTQAKIIESLELRGFAGLYEQLQPI